MNQFRVLIIGCGNIAGRFDMNREPQLPPYTHAGAYHKNCNFQLVGCVEPNAERRKEFMQYWDIPAGYDTLHEVHSVTSDFDVISICSPTFNHQHDLEMAISMSPKLIFCEKPVTTSLSTTEELVQACGRHGISMAVNYTRCWDESINRLKMDIATQKYGELRAVNGIYNKGILNNGSHMVNLLQYLLGKLEIICVGKSIQDYSIDDETIPFWLETNDGVSVQVNVANANDYSIFEMEFIFSRCVIRMEEGGLKWRVRKVQESGEFSGYRVLSDADYIQGDYPQAMTNAVNNIQQHLLESEQLNCTGMDALIAQKFIEALKSV